MNWHEQSGQLQLQSFIRKNKASWFYRFLVCYVALSSTFSRKSRGDFTVGLGGSKSVSTHEAITMSLPLVFQLRSFQVWYVPFIIGRSSKWRALPTTLLHFYPHIGFCIHNLQFISMRMRQAMSHKHVRVNGCLDVIVAHRPLSFRPSCSP